MKSMIIYQITNSKTGMRYIGSTTRSLPCRWKEHLNTALSGGGSRLHRAMRKHGIENFAIRQIASALTLQGMNDAEVALIIQNGTRSPAGYNLTAGGEGNCGWVMPLETRLKIRSAHKGKTLSAEHRGKLSAAKVDKSLVRTAAHQAKIAEANRGKRRSEETKERMSLQRKGVPWTEARRACLK